MRLRDIATAVDLTERRVHAILAELIDSGYVIKVKTGRRNHYEINGQLPLPDFASRVQPVGEILRVLTRDAPTSTHVRGGSSVKTPPRVKSAVRRTS